MAADNPLHDAPSIPPHAPPDTTSPAPRSFVRRLTGIALTLLFPLLIIGGYVYAAARQPGTRSLVQASLALTPTMESRSTPIPQATAPEVAAALRTRYAAFLAQPLALTYEERTWHPTLGELGASLDIDAAAQTIVAAGQTAASLDAQGAAASPRLTLNRPTMQRYLAARAAEAERPAVDARLALQGTTVQTTAAQLGVEVLLDETMQALDTALRTLGRRPLRCAPACSRRRWATTPWLLPSR